MRRLADLEDVPGGSGAVFAPIRCRTHAYTSTNKTALTQNAFVLFPPPNSTTFSLPASPPCTLLFTLFSPPLTLNSPSPTTGWAEPQLLLLLCLSLAFLPSSVGDGANIFPDEPQSAGKVPDERLRLLSALPRLRRGASHLHSSSTRCTVKTSHPTRSPAS